MSFQDMTSSHSDFDTEPWNEQFHEESCRVVDPKGVFAWRDLVLSSENLEGWLEVCQDAKRRTTNVPRSATIEATWERFDMTALYSRFR